jgi:aerobic-type carbon monoxide dehydrogenase small subunit (CoxS/CutS family)
MTVELTINSEPRLLACEDDARLLDVLRLEAGLTSVREGCSVGACGTCTVLLDGKPVSSCLVYAGRCSGKHVETIEGSGDVLDPVQQAFLDCGGLQCGYCTPGFVLSVRALLSENPAPSDDEIRDYLAGNLCRCGAYLEILAAVRSAAATLRGQTTM